MADTYDKVVNVLWTGGLDSSFRMIELSSLPITIQPIYLRDDRMSEEYELNAIKGITEDILKHPNTKCKIKPLIVERTVDVEANDEITSAYKRLAKSTKIGSQYDWLARYALSTGPLELGLEKAKSNKAYNCIFKYGGVLKITEAPIEYYIVDSSKSSDDLISVFGNFRFPESTWNMTKLDEMNAMKSLGFEDAYNKTWFCFTPVNGEPCGRCNPCKSTISEGMSFRFSKAALRRNRRAKLTGPIKQFIIKLKFPKYIYRKFRK